MVDVLEKARNSEPLNKIPRKSPETLRFISFNINGTRTVFNYYPWNELRTYKLMFDSMCGDIITFQELKLNKTDITNSIGNINGYKSYISVPTRKKGYSGVGVFVRIPDDTESVIVKNSLTVLKAEEGITGYLNSPDSKTCNYRDLPSSDSIGGYPDLDRDTGLMLDDQGRCVIIELAANLVVISLYCPANSGGTEEGEAFRMAFLNAVFERAGLLRGMGKEVLIMGDINVSRDLIDNAEGITDRLKQRVVRPVEEDDPYEHGVKFEKVNSQEVIKFKSSSPHRQLLNSLIVEDEELNPVADKFLYDCIRRKQRRRMRMYTVWNTLKNSRGPNYGSRIDLILTTKKWNDCCVDGNIWPLLMGSDHCPVYCDFTIPQESVTVSHSTPKFEARFFYKLNNGNDISSMFNRKREASADPIKSEQTEVKLRPAAMKRTKTTPISTISKKQNVNSQRSISNFFFKMDSKESTQSTIDTSADDTDTTASHSETTSDSATATKTIKLNSISSLSTIYGTPPLCKHNEPCILRTCLNNPKNKGRKFWCCGIDSDVKGADQGIKSMRCEYFMWQKKRD